MSHRLDRPVTQKRLTNIAVVRLRRGGQRFEIACYPNKVLDWRDKVETDLNEVLQTMVVYENVSRGILANSADLERAFGTSDVERCCMIILERGELQEGEKERKAKYESLFRDVVNLVSTMCVNPDTGLPHPPPVISAALHSIHFAVNPAKPAKAQALEAVHALQDKADLPIVRAAMRLRILVPPDMGAVLDAALADMDGLQFGEGDAGRSTTAAGQVSRELVCDPKHFRALEELVGALNASSAHPEHAGYIDILEHAVRDTAGPGGGAGGGGGGGGGGGAGGGGSAAVTAAAPAGARREGRRAERGEREGAEDGLPSFENRVVKPTWSEEATRAAAAGHDAVAGAEGGGRAEGGGGQAAGAAGDAGCRSCRIALPSRAAVREHMSTPWHRLNLKRKVKGEPPLSRDEFDALAPEVVAAAIEETL